MARKSEPAAAQRAPLPAEARRPLRRGALLVLLGFLAWAVGDIAYALWTGYDGSYTSYVAIQSVYVASRVLLGFGSFFVVVGYIRSR